MNPATLRRLLVPLAAAAALGLFVTVAAPALGFHWDPFDRTAKRLAAMEARLADAEKAATQATALARAEADQAVRVDRHHSTVAEAARVAADFTSHSGTPADVESLPADCAARLHDADRRLCALAPDLCAAEAQPAGRGDVAVPPADPAEPPDAGGS
ncbi:MAG: hypothetical protein K2X07_13620 [Caulobacteraceae bacterium]|nr:hypothetical protein [Caulobacteraceae bacterium]